VEEVFAQERLPLIRILGRPLPAQNDKKAVLKYLEGLGAVTSGVDVVGGARLVFGVAGMPTKIKVLVYGNQQAAAAALVRSRRFIAEGRILPSPVPVVIREVNNVLIEGDARPYNRNRAAIARAIQRLAARATAHRK
jgi:hypothetical protein